LPKFMIKKIIRLGTLLGIKESYLLTRNAYGLAVHPFKTLNTLARGKDRSQELLLLFLPAGVLTAGAGFIWVGRRLLATSEAWGWGAKGVAGLFLVFSLALSVYLLFWWARVWLKR